MVLRAHQVLLDLHWSEKTGSGGDGILPPSLASRCLHLSGKSYMIGMSVKAADCTKTLSRTWPCVVCRGDIYVRGPVFSVEGKLVKIRKYAELIM